MALAKHFIVHHLGGVREIPYHSTILNGEELIQAPFETKKRVGHEKWYPDEVRGNFVYFRRQTGIPYRITNFLLGTYLRYLEDWCELPETDGKRLVLPVGILGFDKERKKYVDISKSENVKPLIEEEQLSNNIYNYTPCEEILEFCGTNPRDFVENRKALEFGEKVRIITGPKMDVNNGILSGFKRHPNLELYVSKDKGVEKQRHFISLDTKSHPERVLIQDVHEPQTHLAPWMEFWSSPFIMQEVYRRFNYLVGQSKTVDRDNIVGSIGPENFGRFEGERWIKSSSEELEKLASELERVQTIKLKVD